MGDASWLGAAGGGGPMAAAAADAEERAERFVGLLPGGGGRPLFVDILQWELGLDQKRKVVVRGQERLGSDLTLPLYPVHIQYQYNLFTIVDLRATDLLQLR